MSWTIYEEAVKFLYDNGFVNGMDMDYVMPDSPVKRVDAAVIMYKYLALDDPDNVPIKNVKDVPVCAAQAVATLKYNGIILEKSNLPFGAADNIARGESAIIFFTSSGYELDNASASKTIKSVEKLSKFSGVTGRYVYAVTILAERGIVQGKPSNRFNLTRGQLALMLYRMSQYGSLSVND